MRRKIHENDVRAYIKDTYNLEEEAVFNGVPKEYRTTILNDVFKHYTGYRLFKHGLEHETTKDLFDNYRSFDVDSYEQLTFDLNYTNQQSKNLMARAKRKIHRVRKERFEKRKSQKIEDYTKAAYKLKWKTKSKTTELRLKRLESLKQKEQSKQYER